MRCQIYESTGSFLLTPKERDDFFLAQTVVETCNGTQHYYNVIGKDKKVYDFSRRCPSAEERNLLKEIGGNIDHLTQDGIFCSIESYEPDRCRHGIVIRDNKGDTTGIKKITVEEILKMSEDGKSFYFSGYTRRGKSHLSVGIALYLAEKNMGLKVRAIRSPFKKGVQSLSLEGILRDISHGEETAAAEYRLNQLNSAGLLILDEIGGEANRSENFQTGLLALITNWKPERQLIITSNFSIDELSDKGVDPRIIGRLKEICAEIVLREKEKK